MTLQDAEMGSASPVDLAREADFTLGPLHVRPSVCQAVLGDRSIDLQPRVMQVLVALARGRGRAVSRDALLASCWGGLVVGDDSIHRCISRLRRLSEQEAPGAFRIVTQARVGYRLVDPSAAQTPPAPPDSDVRIADAEPRRGAGPAAKAAAVLALVGLLAAGLLAYRLVASHPARSAYRIAVRDFAAQSAGPDMGRSLADRVAAAVSDRQLPIVARDRSSRGDLGGAHYVVGGSIHRNGPSTRVDIELDDVQSGLALWSDTITRPSAEADALQDQVAGKVADLMDLTRRWLGPGGDAARPEAVAALIKGVEAMRGGQRTLLQTREAFRRFRELAPNSSKAHSAFAMATALGLGGQPPEVAARWRAEAHSEAERAIALDPHNGEGYTALGVLAPSTDLVQRERWFAKGLSMDPDNASLCNFLGNVLLEVGRTKEAVFWMDRSVTLEPLSAPKTDGLIYALTTNGRFADAAALFPRIERLWPDFAPIRREVLMTSLIYAAPTQAGAALDRYQAAEDPLPPDHAEVWRRFEKARGAALSREAARRGLATLAASAREEEIDAVVDALASLGDADGAFQAIATGRARNRRLYASTLYEPATASLRRDARFMAAAQDFGAASYWALTGRRPDFCADEPSAPACRAGPKGR